MNKSNKEADIIEFRKIMDKGCQIEAGSELFQIFHQLSQGLLK